MRVCSICGERNEDWMEICQRCGNSIANADVEEYKAKSNNNKEYKYSYDQNDENYLPKKEKKPIVIENFDLKIVIIILLIVLIALIGYTIFVIS